MATKGLQIRVSSDSTKARADLSRLNKSVKSLDTQAQRLTKSFKQAAIGITAAFSGAAVIRGITKASDGLIGLENQLTLVVGKGKQVNNTLLALRRQSNEVGVSIGQTTTTFNRFGLSLRGKASVEQLLTTTKAINQAAIISGASSESAKAAIIQLGQGLASGTLRGEELNSVLEQTPRIAQAIATGMRVPFANLREEAKAGRITSDAVFKAILDQAKTLDTEYKQLNATVEQFALVAKDNFSFLVAEIDRTLGVSALIRDSLEQLGLAFFEVASNWSTSIRDINSRILLFKLDVRAFVREVNQNLAGLFDVDISQAEFNRRFSSLVSQFEGLLPTIKFNFEPIVLDDYVPNLEAIKTKIEEFTTAVAGFFEMLYTAVIGNSSWPDMWYQGARSITGSLWSSAMRTGRDGVKAFTADIKGYFEKLAPKVKSIWRNMWNRITTLGGNVSVDEFGELNVEQNLLGRSYDSLIAKIDEQNEKLGTQAKLWETIKGRIGRAITAASTLGGAAITDPNTGDVTGFEKNLLGRSVDNASESVGKLQEKLGDLSFESIKTDGVNAFESLKTTISNIEVPEALTNLGSTLIELGKSKLETVQQIAIDAQSAASAGAIIGEEFINKLSVDTDRLGAIFATALAIGSGGRKLALKTAAVIFFTDLAADSEALTASVEKLSRGIGKLIGDTLGGDGETASRVGQGILNLVNAAFTGLREGLSESLGIGGLTITEDEFGELSVAPSALENFKLDLGAAVGTAILGAISVNALGKFLFGKSVFNGISKLVFGEIKSAFKPGSSSREFLRGLASRLVTLLSGALLRVGITAGALLVTPVGLVVGAIATAISAAVATYEWDLDQKVGDVVNLGIKSAANLVGVPEEMSSALGQLADDMIVIITAPFKTLGGAISAAFSEDTSIKDVLSGISLDTTNAFVSLANSIATLVIPTFENLKTGIDQIVTAVKTAAQVAKDLFKSDNSSNVNNIGVNNGILTAGEASKGSASSMFNNPFLNKASGGFIRGPGTGTSDDIPAMLSNGEYVIKASAVSKFGKGFLDRINQGVNPLAFNQGGLVEDDPTFIRLLERRAALGMSLRGAAPSAVAGINEDLVALNKQIAQYAETIAKVSESAAKVSESAAKDSKETNNGVKTGNALTKGILATQKKTKDILESLGENALDVSRQDFLDTEFFGSGIATTSTFDSTGAFAESLKTEKVDSTLKDAFSTALGQALRTGDVKGALTGLLDTVTNKIIDNFVNGIADSLFGEGTGILGSLGDIFGGEEGESPLSGLTKDLKKSVGGLFEGLSDSLGGLFEGIGSLFSGAGGGGGGLLGGLFSIGSSLLGAFGGIGGTTGSFGLPKSFSQGGTVPSTNYSQAGVDSVPALLTPGEMVVKRSAVNNMRQQGGNNSQQVVNLNITGDISTATKKEVMKMIPQIAGGVNYTNRQNNYKG